MADFIPNSDDTFKTWCSNFKTKVASIGLIPAKITPLQTKCDAIEGRVDDKTAKKNAWQSSVVNSNTENNADFASGPSLTTKRSATTATPFRRR